MKYVKTFESYFSNNEEIINEEFIGKVIKSILSIPLSIIAFTVTQFIDPRKIKENVLPNLLNIYVNLDVLIDTLENIHFNKNDITSKESKDIIEKINAFKRIKSKFPTLEMYKKAIGKSIGFFNIRNRKYLANQAMEYTPIKMNVDQILNEIRKVYKMTSKDDIIGEVPSSSDGLLNRIREWEARNQ
jgi:hypothetical protein